MINRQLASMENQYIKELIDRLLQGGITTEEKELLAQWIEQPGNEEKLDAFMEAAWRAFEPDGLLTNENATQMLQAVLQKGKTMETQSAKGRSLRRLKWQHIAVAASFIGVLGTGAYLLIRTLSITQLKNSQTKTNIQINHDVAPPNSVNAVLTLANGQQIILDSAQHGQLATQANIKIIKSANNEISYQTAPGATKDIPNNTLTNPRGSKVATLTLADGTRVWLNAGSSLTFPVAFTGKERTVSLTGEIYFEVASLRLPSGQTMPFKVHFPSAGKEGTIQVLGTHFNVNAYKDEATAKVTLLEGAVNISRGSDKILLKPEQQALLYNSNSKVLNRVDINEVMAWKNGLFIFKGEDINTIMRQIERWYNVEVQYEKPVTEKFYLKMDRRTSVSNVFRILESTGGVHFRINGKKILVRP